LLKLFEFGSLHVNMWRIYLRLWTQEFKYLLLSFISLHYWFPWVILVFWPTILYPYMPFKNSYQLNQGNWKLELIGDLFLKSNRDLFSFRDFQKDLIQSLLCKTQFYLHYQWWIHRLSINPLCSILNQFCHNMRLCILKMFSLHMLKEIHYHILSAY